MYLQKKEYVKQLNYILTPQNKKNSDPARIRTWNLLIRSQTRYPLRHRALLRFAGFGRLLQQDYIKPVLTE